MELEIQRHERINAPVQLVWEEMDSLEQILAKSPQISHYEVVPGGQKARGNSRLTWGPVKWSVDVDVSLDDIVPRQHIRFSIHAPSMETRMEVIVVLTSMGETETKLDYRGTLDVRHRRGHAQGREDPRAQELGERDAGHALHDEPEQNVPGVAVPIRAPRGEVECVLAGE
jgi:carbon monoxide dehydrogenase subunit G